MALNLPQIMMGFIYWILGVFLSWLFVLKIGGWVLERFTQNTGLFFIFTAIKWILFIFIGFILPYMMMQDRNVLDKLIKITGG